MEHLDCVVLKDGQWSNLSGFSRQQSLKQSTGKSHQVIVRLFFCFFFETRCHLQSPMDSVEKVHIQNGLVQSSVYTFKNELVQFIIRNSASFWFPKISQFCCFFSNTLLQLSFVGITDRTTSSDCLSALQMQLCQINRPIYFCILIKSGLQEH